MKVISDITYRIQLVNKGGHGRVRKVIHFNQLKKCYLDEVNDESQNGVNQHDSGNENVDVKALVELVRIIVRKVVQSLEIRIKTVRMREKLVILRKRSSYRRKFTRLSSLQEPIGLAWRAVKVIHDE